MVVADKLTRMPPAWSSNASGEALEVFEDSNNAGGREGSHRYLGVLVEVFVEDALILEVGTPR